MMVLQDINDKFGEYCEGKKVLYYSMVAVYGGCRGGEVVELSKVVAQLKDLKKVVEQLKHLKNFDVNYFEDWPIMTHIGLL